MKIKSAKFSGSAPDLESCPDSDIYEFAFIGRSNVGKSSLINMLTRQHQLAKVSSKPGKTRLINFFDINDGAWTLVDLPGYGYAKTSAKMQQDFHEAVSEYLTERQNLRCVLVLIDSRLKPQKLDLEFTNWLMTEQIPFVLVFTKTDKISFKTAKESTAAFHKAMSEWCDELPRTFLCSSKTGNGRDSVLAFIGEAL